MRARAWAAVGMMVVGIGGDEVFCGELVAADIWSQSWMSSFTAPCWARVPRCDFPVERERMIWRVCVRIVGVPFLLMETRRGTTPASRTRLHRAVTWASSRRGSGSVGLRVSAYAFSSAMRFCSSDCIGMYAVKLVSVVRPPKRISDEAPGSDMVSTRRRRNLGSLASDSRTFDWRDA